MRLWSGMSPEFLRETTRNAIAGRLAAAFESHYRRQVPPGEVRAWQNSLRAMALLMKDAALEDHGVILEYELPLSSRRLDCMLTGKDSAGQDKAVIVELKQWEACEPSDADDLVTTWVGGSHREVLHPSVQVGQYRRYLGDMHGAFHEGSDTIRLESCAYLHNYRCHPDDAILAGKFSEAIADSPLFDASKSDELGGYLVGNLERGAGAPLLRRIEEESFRPSRKLIEYLTDTIDGHSPWVLLDEQLVVFQRVLASILGALANGGKQIVLVRGGPGTGKSVVAINLLARLMEDGRHPHYATASKAFTETLRHLLGARARHLVRYFNSYVSAGRDAVDVLICDEAHRLKERSWSRFTPRDQRRDVSQAEELIHAARVPVFFIDDRQNVRPDEVGSADLIRDTAQRLGLPLTEMALEVQFRCAGSEGFINWIENTLEIRRTANVLWSADERFDFRIAASAREMEALIRERVAEGSTGRLTAGFCWRWSNPNPDGSLVDDVVFVDADGAEFRRPWNAKPWNGRGRRPQLKDAPEASLWATDPRGFGQVGCVYTAQGFEFDYAGLIWGPDLVYDLDAGSWVVRPERSHDKGAKKGLTKSSEGRARLLELVKNTYRVLLSRGMKGCYVYFTDKDTERFVRSRMEQAGSYLKAAEARAGYRKEKWPP